jgi:hypothetical protein
MLNCAWRRPGCCRPCRKGWSETLPYGRHARRLMSATGTCPSIA